jgi:AAA+ ATPase superfamily predicted ATPase
MPTPAFIGRKNELALLETLHQKNIANFVVIKGRRRIGKSTLVEKFAENKNFYSFAGLPPTPGITRESQLNAFFNQLKFYFPYIPTEIENQKNWWNLLDFLAEQVSNLNAPKNHSKIIILFDEISWMAFEDPEFLGIIKTIWDKKFKTNQNLILFLCGSVSSWIEQNIIASTGFVGRISLNLTLKELPLHECNLFFNQNPGFSAYEKFKFLSVSGGIPKYLEEFRISETAEENIKTLCFSPHGFLFHEFDQIFNDSFSTQLSQYREIIEVLAEGSKTRDEISEELSQNSGGYLSECLDNLISAGFIQRDFTWSIKEKKYGKLSTYRLSDNYIRFYLKYISSNKISIEQNLFQETSIDALPGWASILGLQFENLVLNNIPSILKLLNIPSSQVMLCNPYFQKTTSKQKGCQIDLLIQTTSQTLYVCEVKFSRNPIGKSIAEEVAAKCNNLNAPKGFSKLPVLIHVNGVDDSVIDDHDFFKIIDFGDFLKPPF